MVVLVAVTGMPRLSGAIVGLVVGGLVVADPTHRIWTKATSRRLAATSAMAAGAAASTWSRNRQVYPANPTPARPEVERAVRYFTRPRKYVLSSGPGGSVPTPPGMSVYG